MGIPLQYMIKVIDFVSLDTLGVKKFTRTAKALVPFAGCLS